MVTFTCLEVETCPKECWVALWLTKEINIDYWMVGLGNMIRYHPTVEMCPQAEIWLWIWISYDCF